MKRWILAEVVVLLLVGLAIFHGSSLEQARARPSPILESRNSGASILTGVLTCSVDPGHPGRDTLQAWIDVDSDYTSSGNTGPGVKLNYVIEGTLECGEQKFADSADEGTPGAGDRGTGSGPALTPDR